MEREQLTATVRAAQQGDEKALNLLFNTYYNDVYYFALKTLKDKDLACDITQETFVEIINTLQDLKEPAAFVTWMRQVTYHQCTRYFKKKKEVLVEEDENGNTLFDSLEEEREEFIPGEGVDQEDFRATILALLDTLSEEQRAAVLMHYYHEMSVKEIAETQKVSEGTVKSRLNYARKSLKKSVEDYEKKHDVKLHCAGVLPLLLWLFATAGKETMPVAAANTVAGGIASATGMSIVLSTGGGVAAATVTTAAGTGLMAKIAALPVAVKIISGITAGALLIGSVAVANNNIEKDSGSTIPVIMQTNPSTGENQGQNNSTDEPTVPTSPAATQPGQTSPDEDLTIPPTEPMVPPQEQPEGPSNPSQEVPSEPDIINPSPDLPDDDTQTSTPTPPDKEPEFSPVVEGFVPEGCVYTTGDGVVLEAGAALPEAVSYNDVFISEDYHYEYTWGNGGWSVSALDKTKTEYAPIYSVINGEPVTIMSQAFSGCENLLKSPAIPETIRSIERCFENCKSLIEAPAIGINTTSMRYAFQGCTALVKGPIINANATDLTSVFNGCSSLKEAFLPISATDLSQAFANCVSLEIAPAIPDSVTALYLTFSGCTALREVSALPDGITNMAYTFEDCVSLVVSPVIPSQVTSMNGTYKGCTSLKQVSAVPSGVEKMDMTFSGCTALVDFPDVPASVTTMGQTFLGCISMIEAPKIYAENPWLSQTFRGCTNLRTVPMLSSNATTLYQTFYDCTSLEYVASLPNGVTEMESTFVNCSSLVSLPKLPEGLKKLWGTFSGCTSLTEISVNLDVVETMYYTFSGCTSLSGTITINSNPTNIISCFSGTAKPIVLTGTSEILADIAATSSAGNVTVDPAVLSVNAENSNN